MKKAKTCCSIHYHSLLPVDFCSLLFPTLCTGIRWTIQTFQIPPALYSESRFLQVCLCPLPSVEEMWYQRSHTSAFLWKLQRAKKDGKVVCCTSCHFVDDYLECAACRIWHVESKRLDSRLFICEQYDRIHKLMKYICYFCDFADSFKVL